MLKEIKKAIKKKVVKVKSVLRTPVMTKRNSNKFNSSIASSINEARRQQSRATNKGLLKRKKASIISKAKTENSRDRALARLQRVARKKFDNGRERERVLSKRKSKGQALQHKKREVQEKIMSEFKAVSESSARKPQGSSRHVPEGVMNPDYHLANFKKALHIRRAKKYKKQVAEYRLAKIRNIRAGRDKYNNG